jgi:hypothetical protein
MLAFQAIVSLLRNSFEVCDKLNSSLANLIAISPIAHWEIAVSLTQKEAPL